jgi:HEAT repeat protein
LIPALSPLLRNQIGDVLHAALFAARCAGPDAAPLVPDLISNLEKEEVAGNIAAMALGAVGEGAAAAVPALRALLRKGGKWRGRASEALGGIGAPARPALPEIGAILKQQQVGLCSTEPRYSEAEAIASAIGKAVPNIGGSEVEPLVPDLVAAFQTMRGCNLIGAVVDDWLKRFGALGKYGTAARPLLLSILENANETPALRRAALAALDQVGTPFGSLGKVRGLRKALARKEEIFERAFNGPAMQILPPPPPPARTPREFFLCREEAGLALVTEPPASAARPDRADKTADGPFASCLHGRLCGPDEDAYRATMAKCCAFYGASPPWFCALK